MLEFSSSKELKENFINVNITIWFVTQKDLKKNNLFDV